MMLSIFLPGCQRPEVDSSTPDEPKTMQPAETTPEELSRRTEAFYERAMEDSSLIETREYEELLDAHGPAFKRLLIERIREADHITITEQSDQLDYRSQMDCSKRFAA